MSDGHGTAYIASDALLTAIKDNTQEVKSSVKIEWATGRNMKNLKVTSSEDIYATKSVELAPVAYYRLGETSGTTMTDSSGNSLTGTYTGAVTLNQTGFIGADTDKAVTSTAASSSTTAVISNINDNNLLDIPSTITLEFWLKTGATQYTGVDYNIIQKGSSSTDYNFAVQFSGNVASNGRYGSLVLRGSNGTVARDLTTQVFNAVALNGTYHIVFTYDTVNGGKMYINGDEVVAARKAASGSMNTNSGQVSLRLAQGQILDEVSIYNYVLLSGQIKGRYLSGTNTGSAHSSQYFTVKEASNGRTNLSYRWGVCDALDADGHIIRADGNYVCMENTPSNDKYEYGMWSRRKSSVPVADAIFTRSGNATRKDSTVVGTNVPRYETGKFAGGKSIYIEGSNGSHADETLTFPSTNSISVNEGSLEMWINPQTINTENNDFCWGSPGTDGFIIRRTGTGTAWSVEYYTVSAGTKNLTATMTISTNTWYHLIFTWGPGTNNTTPGSQFYVNGVLKASDPALFKPPSATTAYIGQRPGYTFGNALYDDFRLRTRQVTSTDATSFSSSSYPSRVDKNTCYKLRFDDTLGNDAQVGFFADTDHPTLIHEFDPITANWVRVWGAEFMGKIKRFDFYYKDGSGNWKFIIRDANEIYEYFHDHRFDGVFGAADGPTDTCTGVRVEILETWNPQDLARIQEWEPYWREEMEPYVVDLEVSKVRDNFEGSVPIGATSSNEFSITFDNTGKDFNPYSATARYGPYLAKDVKAEVYLGWKKADTTYEYVPQGVYFADEWELSSDNMLVTGRFRDYSKFLQENEIEGGIFFRDKTAGEAIAALAKSGGVPESNIQYVDRYEQVVMSTSNLLSFYRFMEKGGRRVSPSTTATDLVGTNNGTYYGNPLGNIDGPHGGGTKDRALNLDGIDDYVGLVDNIVESNSTTLSIEMWFRTSASGVLFGYQTTTPNTTTPGGYVPAIYVGTDGKLRGQLWQGAVSPITTSGTVNDGKWHHVVLAAGFSTQTLYLDGVSVGTLSGTRTTFGGTKNQIGAGYWGSSWPSGDSTKPWGYFKGDVDDVSTYSTVLNATQVSDHFTSNSALRIFPYLFAKDATLWDAMLEFATADLGMFYFDDYGQFHYEYAEEYYVPSYQKFNVIQHDFADVENIISATKSVELQTNKVIVKVNPLITLTNASQGIWRAENNTTLATKTLSVSLDATNTTSTVINNVDNPYWSTSGWMKIDNEIIGYSGRSGTTLTGLTRGMFNSVAAAHTPGTLVREARLFEIEYDNQPVVQVDYPYTTLRDPDFYPTPEVDIDYFIFTEFTAKLVISVAAGQAADTVFILEGTNPVSELNFATAITGIPIIEESASEQKMEKAAQYSENIRRYGIKSFEIDNRFINDGDKAQQIAAFVIKHFQNPVPIIRIDTLCIPHVQLGDRVRIVSLAQFDVVNREYWVIENTINYDGGVKQSLTLREVS